MTRLVPRYKLSPRVMGLRSSGPAIKLFLAELKTAVERKGISTAGLEVDEVYGPIAAGIVEQIQKKAGLPVNGVVDPDTRVVLQQLYGLHINVVFNGAKGYSTFIQPNGEPPLYWQPGKKPTPDLREAERWAEEDKKESAAA